MTRIVCLLLLVLLAGCGTTTERKMILHTVAFSLEHSKGSKAEQDFLAAGMALAKLPMVKNFRCYRQVGLKNDFDFGFAMEFESEEDYQAYNQHPLHQNFVETRWKKEVSDFLELDYVDYQSP